MEPILARISDRGTAPTRQDIADLLASIGEPGKQRDEKIAAVEQLYRDSKYRATNFQGHHVKDMLDSFEEF